MSALSEFKEKLLALAPGEQLEISVYDLADAVEEHWDAFRTTTDPSGFGSLADWCNENRIERLPLPYSDLVSFVKVAPRIT